MRGKYKRKREAQVRRALSVEKMGLPSRVLGILKEHDILTLADLVGRTKEELLSIPGIGAISAQLILDQTQLCSASIQTGESMKEKQ